MHSLQDWLTAEGIISIPARVRHGKHHPALWRWSECRETVRLPREITTGLGLSVLTGVKSGVFVVDIDPRNGGSDTWRELVSGRDIPETLKVHTAGGGVHYYFTCPEPLNKSTHGLGRGVDVLGEDSAPTFAGTRPDGSTYTQELRRPSDPPLWLWDSLTHLRHSTAPARPANGTLEALQDPSSPCEVMQEQADRLYAAARAGDRESTLRNLQFCNDMAEVGHVGFSHVLKEATPMYISGRNLVASFDGRPRNPGPDWLRMVQHVTRLGYTQLQDPCAKLKAFTWAGNTGREGS